MTSKVTGFLLAGALCATLVFAQRPFDMGGTPPDPATMIQMRVSFLASLLSLTDAQKTSATTIFTNANSAGQSIQASLQTNRQSLSDAVKKNDTASIDTLAIMNGTLSGQLTAINTKAEAAIYAILTADQQAKYATVPHGGPGPMGPRGFGPPPQ